MFRLRIGGWPAATFALFVHICCHILYTLAALVDHKDWTNSGYPDIRGPTSQLLLCAPRLPKNGSLLYICDPDRILNATQLLKLNSELEKLAVSIPCPCQRKSQCSSGSENGNPFHGFVVSIALVDHLQMNFHSPSEQQLVDRAESFCKTLEGRWALGDCGNSVLVFVWRHYKKMLIWPARLAEKYVSSDERRDILVRVNDLIQTDKWVEALLRVIGDIRQELKGKAEKALDTGIISLVLSVGVASLLTIIITLCVCAFRCCGNITPNSASSGAGYPDSRRPSKRVPAYSSSDTPLQNSLANKSPGVSRLQNSLSKGPHTPIGDAAPAKPLTPLNQTTFPDTTLV